MTSVKIAKIAVLAACALGCLACLPQNKTVELPLTIHEGYGPFKASSGGISPIDRENEANPWHKTYPEISKLPEGLVDIESSLLYTNIHQHVYQNYIAGNISKEFYDGLQKSWNWIPDTTVLSKTPVRTLIAFAYGKDAEGEAKFVLDTNGNLDLSDDKFIVPVYMDSPIPDADKDSVALANAVRVSVETFVHNKIVPVSIPVFIMYHKGMDMYFNNFVQHATAQYKGVSIAISGHRDLSFDKSEFAIIPDDPTKKLDRSESLLNNEHIEINGEILKIIGVNTNKNVLVLEKSDLSKEQLFSTQVGYKAPPFAGEEFTSKEPVSLEALKGKYVLLDFWGTWCGPCIAEFPNLKELYAETDRSQFEIVGIVGASQPDWLTASLEQHGLEWPQILSDETNNIVATYGINSYPTTFLVDPEGVIIAKNLRGKELEDKVMSLIGQ